MTAPKNASTPQDDPPRPMTYRELKAELAKFGEEQLDQSVSLLSGDNNEVYPVFDMVLSGDISDDAKREELEDVVGADAILIVF